MVEHRTWGDGATKALPHMIEDINLSVAEPWIRCGTDAAVVTKGPYLTLDRAWMSHIGREYKLPPLGALASDSEVHEFLRHVEDPRYVSTVAGAPTVTREAADLDAAFDLLDRLHAEWEAASE